MNVDRCRGVGVERLRNLALHTQLLEIHDRDVPHYDERPEEQTHHQVKQVVATAYGCEDDEQHEQKEKPAWSGETEVIGAASVGPPTRGVAFGRYSSEAMCFFDENKFVLFPGPVAVRAEGSLNVLRPVALGAGNTSRLNLGRSPRSARSTTKSQTVVQSNIAPD